MAEAPGKASIRISDDKMVAEANVRSGVETTAEDVQKALAERGIVLGIDATAINVAIENRGAWIKVAEGDRPTKTVHGTVVLHFEKPGSRKQHSEELGEVDFKNLGLIVNARAGERLASLVPPVPGLPGCNILGQITHVEEGRPATLQAGKNTRIEGDDLLASINGRIVLDSGGKISVEPDLVIVGDVGPATGNIDFIGPITVHGNVCTDYKLKSADRITIKGHIEGALVDGHNGITVAGGVFGAGKAVLQSRGDIEVKHAQDAALLCGGTIKVAESLLRVRSVAGVAVLLETGTIVGGSTTAPRVELLSAGNESGTKTVIEIGIAPRVKLNADRMEKDFIQHRATLLKKRSRLAPLVAAHNAGKILQKEDKDTLAILETECAGIENTLYKIAAEIRALLLSPGACVPGDMTLFGEVFPGVVISSVHSEHSITSPRSSLHIAAADGKLILA